MSIDFQTITNFKGYVTKPDQTNVSARFLGTGSKNMIINDAERVETRGGLAVFGADSTTTTPIQSSFDWLTNVGTEINLRSYDDELEVYLGTIDGIAVSAWTRVADGWTAVDFSYTTWWDDTEKRDLCLFVNGADKIYEWNGAVATIASATSNTITKNGTTTWAEAGFYTTRNKTIEINGTTYTYTGGESTTTLTGVTPDPSGEAADSVALQSVITNDNEPADTTNNDWIATNANNQIFVGSEDRRTVEVSTTSDFKDFSFSSPRAVGEGAALTLDSYSIDAAEQEGVMYIAGKDEWYATEFRLQSTSSAFIEDLTVRKLKTGAGQGLKARDLLTKTKNGIVFVTNEPTIDEIARIENINTPQSKPISDPIKPDINAATFTNGGMTYFQNKIYIAVPSDSTVYIYDIENGWWNPPQEIALRRFSIIGGVLYGHSSSYPVTYTAFSGTDDNGANIDFNATFVYRHFGDRDKLKNFDRYYTEGYIDSGTEVTMTLLYDYKGGRGEREFTIDSSDTDIIFDSTGGDPSLGKESLGKAGLGSILTAVTDLPKFRVIHDTAVLDFYELQTKYTANATGARFQLLAHGPNARISSNRQVTITK